MRYLHVASTSPTCSTRSLRRAWAVALTGDPQAAGTSNYEYENRGASPDPPHSFPGASPPTQGAYPQAPGVKAPEVGKP